jgi:uncharacterized protein with PQ loop repeat
MVQSNHIRSKKNQIHFLNDYIHFNNFKHKFQKNISILSFLGPLITVPQVIRIWINKSAHDISIITWTGYLALGIIWLIYGIIYKDRHMVISSTLWMVLYLLIIAGKVLYG